MFVMLCYILWLGVFFSVPNLFIVSSLRILCFINVLSVKPIKWLCPSICLCVYAVCFVYVVYFVYVVIHLSMMDHPHICATNPYYHFIFLMYCWILFAGICLSLYIYYWPLMLAYFFIFYLYTCLIWLILVCNFTYLRRKSLN